MPIVVKGDGSREAFEIAKLIGSLRHAGASQELAASIAGDVAKSIREGMTTTEIYRKAFSMLRKEERVTAARYSMRRAILDLGPTGFPFEDYVSALMRAKGYAVRTRVILQGKCIDHEVDVVMEKGERHIGAELKFHNTPGFKTDVKTALYVRARFTDIGNRSNNARDGVDEGWLITNTKFTENAIQYASCAGIHLLGWSYPTGAALKDIIKETGVYPVTVLTTLSKSEKSKLILSGTTMCKAIADDPDSLSRAGITGGKLSEIVAESQAVCSV